MTHRTPPIVCIVEDEMDILLLLRVIVQSSTIPCTVSVHQSGYDLLSFANDNTISLVITDLTMHDMDGLQIAEQMMERQPSCVIAIVTAYATQENKKRAKEVGVKYFIAKPFSLSEIEAVLHEVLD